MTAIPDTTSDLTKPQPLTSPTSNTANHHPPDPTDQKKPLTEKQQLLNKPRTNLLHYFTDDTQIASMWKDVLVIGIAYFTFRLCYLSYIFNLGELFSPDLAFATLATSFGAETVTSLFLPTLIIRKLGCKMVIIVVASTTLLFGCAEFAPSYYTFIPCGILLGAGYSCLWVALATYLTNLSQLYIRQKTTTTLEATLGLFLGVVCFMGAFGGVLGNIITYIILGPTEEQIDSVYFGVNRTITCGAQYCEHPLPVVVNATVLSDETFESTQEKSRTTLFLTYIVLGLIGPVSVALGLNRRQKLEQAMRKEISALQQIGATVIALKNVNLALLSFSCFLNGLTFSFASGNFSQAYVDCAIGSEFVAVVAVVHLTAYGIASFCSGALLKYISIMDVFLFINISTEVVYILLLLWKPTTDGLLIACAFSGWLGAFVATYTNLLNTLCGIILHGDREATFAFFRVFYSLGSTVGFAGTNHTCTKIMIISFMILIIIGTFMYLIAEYRIRKERKAATSS